MGLSENARRKRNEKEKKKRHSRGAHRHSRGAHSRGAHRHSRGAHRHSRGAHNCEGHLCTHLEAEAESSIGPLADSQSIISSSSTSSSSLTRRLSNGDEVGQPQKFYDALVAKYGDASANNEDPNLYRHLLDPLSSNIKVEEGIISLGKLKEKEEGKYEVEIEDKRKQFMVKKDCTRRPDGLEGIEKGVTSETSAASDKIDLQLEEWEMEQLGLPPSFPTKKKLHTNNQAEHKTKELYDEPYGFCNYNMVRIDRGKSIKGTSNGKFHFGMLYMKIFGWKQGSALGKDGQGILYPLEMTIKLGRSGIGAAEESREDGSDDDDDDDDDEDDEDESWFD